MASKLHLVEWYIYGLLLWSLKLAVLVNVMRLMVSPIIHTCFQQFILLVLLDLIFPRR